MIVRFIHSVMITQMAEYLIRWYSFSIRLQVIKSSTMNVVNKWMYLGVCVELSMMYAGSKNQLVKYE